MRDRSFNMLVKSVLILSLFLVGCSANLLIVDRYGMPVPHEVVSIDSVSDISCTFYFVRMYEKGKESVYPEYLPMEKWVKLPKDTTDVSLVLNIFNPRREHIRVVKRIKVNGLLTSKFLYEGNDMNRTFQLKGPVRPGTQVEMAATVTVKQLPVIEAGRALYTVK